MLPGASCPATPTPGSADCTGFAPRPCTATSSVSARTGRAQMTSCKKPSSGPGVTCRGSAPMTGPSRNGCSVSRNLLTDADQAARSRPIPVQDHCAEDVRDDTWLDQVLDRQLVSGVLQYL